jgi:translation initiation factor IF-2
MSGKTIELPNQMTVRDLAQRIEASPIEVIKILMSNGVMANINQMVDYDTAAIVAAELGFETSVEKSKDEPEIKENGEIPLWKQIIAKENPKNLVNRPPVVTILGHVDHGKTTLLDAIRNTDVAGGEAGGITQHIGAYQIEHKGRLISFLDTPGHAAFTAMRARGAQGADIVILVVAANDGVMPQTKEAIAHAQAARVPIIVALNKIDRPDANPDFTKRQLAEAGLVPDEWGGNTMVVPVSAKQRKGLPDLMEAILLVADSNDIKANPQGKVMGTVIEAELDKAKGVMATLLVQNGTLQMGDVVLAGKAMGRIRAMFDYRGKKLRAAPPSSPVRIMGLSEVPVAGDIFNVYANEKDARAVVMQIKLEENEKKASVAKVSLEDLFTRVKAGEMKELKLIVKADVQGSLEPIMNSLRELNKEGEIKVNILYGETGNITENDVNLAAASKAVVLGFNVQADVTARRLADSEGISLRLYDIIYRMIEDIEKALKGMLEPEFKEIFSGNATVLAVFKISKVGAVAGCRVTQGEVRRNSKIRIKRGGDIVYEGEVSSIKHEKEDVREVRQGFECGISFKNFNTFQVGDSIEAFSLEKNG